MSTNIFTRATIQNIITTFSLIGFLFAGYGYIKEKGSNENKYSNLRFETPAQTQKAISWLENPDKIMFESDVNAKLIILAHDYATSDTAIIRKHDSDIKILISTMNNMTSAFDENTKITRAVFQKILQDTKTTNNKN